jgi:Peptidase family M28/PA domain/PDZ domain
MIRNWLAVGLLSLSVVSGVALGQETVQEPVLQRMKKDIFFLAGEECEGRGTETKGFIKAGQYVADSFKASGLKPAGTDGYFQPFTINTAPRLEGTNRLKFTAPDGEKYEVAFNKEFRPTAFTGTGKASGELVFVGYGITAKKLDIDGKTLDYDDYAGIDVAGKIVVMMRRTPQAEAKKNPFEKDASAQYAALATKVALANEKKAAGIIFVNDATYAKDADALIDFRGSNSPVKIPVLSAKRAVLEKMLASQDKKLEDIEKAIDKDLKPQPLVLKGWKMESEVSVTKNGIGVRNVVAVSEGHGPLAEETIVIGAHYDHLGYGEPGSLMGAAGKGKLHYGADDNGSGTTGLLEMARRFGSIKNREGRRIVFIAFAGEERGLFGSIHYCKEPTFPLDKTVFMLNMDMIGRVTEVEDKDDGNKKKGRLVVYGTGTAEGLDDFVIAQNKKFDFKMLKLPGGTGPSDHDSFYRKKIPVLFFFTGTHKDYHRPTDTPDKINLEGIQKVVALGEECLKHFSTCEKPKYLVTKGGWSDPTEEPAAARPARPAMPKLGIMPGNYESTEGGVLVEDLTPGGAAEKAGVKPKDVVIEIAGKPIKDIEAYMKAMAGQKAGVEMEIVVIRGEKKVKIKVTPLAP